MYLRVYFTFTYISVIVYSCLFRLLNADLFTDTKVMFRVNDDYDCVYDNQEYQVQDGDTVTTGIYSQFNIALAEFIHVDKFGSEPKTIFTSEKFRFDGSINYGNFEQVIVNKLFEGQWDFGFYLDVASSKQVEHLNKNYTYVPCYVSVSVEEKPNNDTGMVDFLLPNETNCSLTGNVGKYQVYENDPLSFRITSAFEPRDIKCAANNREQINLHNSKDFHECFPRQNCWRVKYKTTATKSSKGNWTCVFRSKLDTRSNCTFNINVLDRDLSDSISITSRWIIYSAVALLAVAGSSFAIWIVRVTIRRRRARSEGCAVTAPPPGAEPTVAEQHPNVYEEVYDDVYEARRNRQRLIEKLLREMNTKRPPPPPVETMPRGARRAPAASSQAVCPQRPLAAEQ